MWYHLFINDSNTAVFQSRKFRDAVFEHMVLSGNEDVAVFHRSDEESGGVHFYFTPSSRRVAVNYGASPCQKPTQAEVGEMLVGGRGAVDRLFEV